MKRRAIPWLWWMCGLPLWTIGCEDIPPLPGGPADAAVTVDMAQADMDVPDAAPADMRVADMAPPVDMQAPASDMAAPMDMQIDAAPVCADSGECADGQLCVAGACVACDTDEACAGDARYAMGASCVDGSCVPCPAGDLGCACDAGTCTAGACLDDVCVDCAPGALACACAAGDACDLGGRCEAGRCVDCPRGDDGCPCGANQFCRGDGVCTDGVCAAEACRRGTDGCPCVDDACDAGLYCGDDRLCQACGPEIEGCPCDADEGCGADLYCDAETICRTPEVCAHLDCAPRQLCREPELAGERPRCLEECEDGFIWNAEAEECDVEPPPGESCVADAANSILARCATENRQCDEPVIGEAQCGACLKGFVADADVCRAPRQCAALECAAENRACVEPADADARCEGCLPDFVEEAGRCVPPPGPTCDELDCAAQNRACVGEPDAVCAGCLPGFEDQGGACVARVDVNCTPGAEGSLVDACAAERRTCVVMGAGAACGGCVMGFAEANGACVEAVLCADLDCAARGRTCAGDPFAACGDCADGFVERDGQCVDAVFCEDLDCAERGRACDGEPQAVCGDCLPGSQPADPDDPSSACVSPLTCADIACEPGDFCLEGVDGGDAFCSAQPCLEGEALREDQNRCVQCDVLCGEPGETGRVYPFTQVDSDNCLCETETGFYADVAGAIRARPCDADGDGWVRISAKASLESVDDAIRANARCNLRIAEGVVLQNEYGQATYVQLCAEGPRPSWDGPCEAPAQTPLYESVRNDDPIELARDPDVPAYVDDGVGRALRPAEINPLTKGCTSALADYNDNGLADVGEHQESQADDDLEPVLRAWHPFTHFVELHAVEWIQRPGAYGRVRVRERSRCAEGFAFEYAAGEGDWWRQCARNRESTYTQDRDALTPIGYDFAQFACAQDAEGSCVQQPPPLNALAGEDVPAHGLCQVQRPFLQGGWRGMTHASQFRCAHLSVADELPENRMMAPQRILPAELYNGVQDGRTWQFNRCRVACPADDPDCIEDCSDDGCVHSAVDPGGLAAPSQPRFECSAVVQDPQDTALVAGVVGFVAARYIQTPGSYVRGCVDEWSPSHNREAWRGLCPGYTQNPRSVIGSSSSTNFGRIICGCGFNYGGPACALGCAASRVDLDGDGALETDVGAVHYGGEHEGAFCQDGYCPVDASDPDGGRLGYWACGNFGITSAPGVQGDTDLTAEGYRLQGEVSRSVFAPDLLCQNADCAAGWSVRGAGAGDL